MKFLIDTSPASMKTLMEHELVCGQLQTPLTNYKNAGGPFAMDNGAFSKFHRDQWFRMLEKNKPHLENCLFVTMPDVPFNARRTTELYFQITQDARTHPWVDKWAFVIQDGHEDLPLDWNAIRYLFVGGSDLFKDSTAAKDICKVAIALDIPVHVGRINGVPRYLAYRELGAVTCDGSGLVKDPTRLDEISRKLENEDSQLCMLDYLEKMEIGDEHSQHDDSREVSDQRTA